MGWITAAVLLLQIKAPYGNIHSRSARYHKLTDCGIRLIAKSVRGVAFTPVQVVTSFRNEAQFVRTYVNTTSTLWCMRRWVSLIKRHMVHFPSGLIFTRSTCLLRSLHIQMPGLFCLSHTVIGVLGVPSQTAVAVAVLLYKSASTHNLGQVFFVFPTFCYDLRSHPSVVTGRQPGRSTVR